MSDLASISITVSRNVFKSIRTNLEGIFPHVDAKIKWLPSAKVEITLALPETENNEAAMEDFLFMVGSYLRIFRRAEQMAQRIEGGLDFTKTVKVGGIPVA